MGLGDWITKRVTNRITRQQQLDQRSTVSKNRAKQRGLASKVIVRQRLRQREDVGNWRSATQLAESVENPNRTSMIRIYKDVVVDGHLSALMRTIILKCLASGYWLENKEGKQHEEGTFKINQPWFVETITHALDSMFWGHSLVQFNGPITPKGFTSVQLFPRENVVPEVKAIKPEADISSGLIPYNTPEFKKWIAEFGGSHELGLLFKATPLVLWKKNVTIAWSEYAEVFGMPLRVGRTDIQDPVRKRNMEDMLDKLGGSGHATLDESDIIEFIQTNNEDAHHVFKEFIEMANKELSKLIVGQTMTNEDGSSRSQAEVHDDLLTDFIISIKRWLTNQVEDKIMPIMVAHKMIPEGLFYKYDMSEKISLTEEFSFLSDLLNNFDVDPKWITERFGVPVELKPEPKPDPTKPKPVVENSASVIKKVHDYYKNWNPNHHKH